MILNYTQFSEKHLSGSFKLAFALFLSVIVSTPILAYPKGKRNLSFSTSSLTYSVGEDGTTANKSTTLWCDRGNANVTLTKSAGWIVLPSPGLGSLSFGINATGLASGSYSADVSASAPGCNDATLRINLTVTSSKKLSFSTSSISYSVVRNGATAKKSATLSASTGSPTISLSKSAPWVVLPSAGLGFRSFGINSSGLLPGNYSATVTASAIGYKSASLHISLTIIVQKKLSFSTSSLSYSVVQNGTTAEKSATLSASTGSPAISLSKSAPWVVLPSAGLGYRSFGINSSGLSPGNYSATVTASAIGYKSASLYISLTIIVQKKLSFSTRSLSYSVVQNGTTAKKSATLSASTGTPAISLSKSARWVVLPSAGLGSRSFGINSSGLSPGNYSATVTASATGYKSASLHISLTITVQKKLSFSTSSLSYSVVQNGATAKKLATLFASTGTPAISLSKSDRWVVLPSAGLGFRSFGINSSGLSPGNYSATVTASASGYKSASLHISLTVTLKKTLSFSTTSLSYSVVQNGTTAKKSATLSGNTGSPTISMSKSARWVVLPSAGLGSRSFGINSSGLSPGNYSATVIASASGYKSASLHISLTVTAQKKLSFSTSSLSYSVVQNGATAKKSATLSASTGSPTISLSKSALWVVLPSSGLGSKSFGINSSGLSPGNYSATVIASASGYKSASLHISLTVTLKKTLSFSTTSLSYSVVQNGTTAKKSATLSGNTGSPTISMSKSAPWVVLPSAGLGSRSFGINSSGLSPGNYSATVIASASGYKSASLHISLTVTAQKKLSFSTSSLSYSVVQNGATAKKSATLSASTGSPTISLSKSAPWVVLPSSGLGSKSFGINSSGLSPGNYSATVKASAAGYTSAILKIAVTVKPQPSVVSVNPANGATNVSENGSISTNVLKLPGGGINNNTITSSSVYLTENATGTVVRSHANGTGGGDGITLVPTASLKLSTTYKFHITPEVKDLSGASFTPYSSTFTTKSAPTVDNVTIGFDKVTLPNATGQHTSITIGPDGKLYALTNDGIIKRFVMNTDGTLQNPELIYSLQDHSGSRTKTLAVGFAFDPSSTATNLIAWVTHCSYIFTNAPDWDGKLTKLSGSKLQNVQDVVINLPRSTKDHVTNSIAFGPDGGLYFTQGSTSAMGRSDLTWGNRNEHLLSAAVLRLDLSKLGTLPLNVKTSEGGGTYNPYNANAPLTIYASGTRNAFDLVWHSNGSLYVPTNGSAAGGNTPASTSGILRINGATYSGPSIPALTSVQQTQKDFLFRVVKGGYYGHPNALRGEYVMNGGNPTSGTDKAEVASYPVGTLPDANWRGYAFDFKNNVSPDGAIEYKSSTFNGALKGKLLVVRYSQFDDIITLTPGPTKDIVSSIEGKEITGFSGFFDPVDLTENVKNGNIYVSEYGGGKITLLKPHNGKTVAKSNEAAIVSVSPPAKEYPSCDDTVAIASQTEMTAGAGQIADISERPRINPNPVHKKFDVEFPKTYEGDFTLQIIDPLGKVYGVGEKRLSRGGSNISIDISKFSFVPGVYFLKIQSDVKTDVIKLLVQ